MSDWQSNINTFTNIFIFLFLIQYIFSFFKQKHILTNRKILANCTILSLLVIFSLPLLDVVEIELDFIIDFPFRNP
ncbi:hypothetical protein AMD00_07155 [Viridibacillus arvi]|uniref:Uncharacterized protein n=1 Tax=Viridibacillus arvi TaxID=263475 RepID=A0A0M0LMF2_9BACL|nr:hypothetical protein AMD00_07155 [Viridibacillus arvi]